MPASTLEQPVRPVAEKEKDSSKSVHRWIWTIPVVVYDNCDRLRNYPVVHYRNKITYSCGIHTTTIMDETDKMD